jgi:hypothetical protein
MASTTRCPTVHETSNLPVDTCRGKDDGALTSGRDNSGFSTMTPPPFSRHRLMVHVIEVC